MSLINPKGGWIRFDGTPLPGITPPQVRLRSGTLTPERLAAVSDIYSKFTTARRLSVAGSGYFTADRKLPDGTIVRMVSINDVDHVHIWAADTAPEETLDVTFWCQPWDDEWIDEQFAEVFIIPRWLEIGSGEDEVLKEDFLKDLVRSTAYEPPLTSGYPGNQTWFAPPGHPAAGIVVSWWGQMRRYSRTLLEHTIDTAGTWRRATDPYAVNHNVPQYLVDICGRSGGIAGALAGQMFHADGVFALPSGVTSTPTRNAAPSSGFVWVNGTKIAVEYLGFSDYVMSACVGIRGDDQVLRVVVRKGASTISIVEHNFKTQDWVELGVHGINAASVGMPGSGWLVATAAGGHTHPFYWNADGTEAMGIVMYEKDTTEESAVGGVHALLKLTVSASATSVTLMEYGTTTRSYYGSGTSNNHSGTSVIEYSAVLAADYIGNAPQILRTHLRFDGTWTRTYSDVNTVDYADTATYTDIYNNEYTVVAQHKENVKTSNGDLSVSASSWASLNGTAISGTAQMRSMEYHNSSVVERAQHEQIVPATDPPPEAPGALVDVIVENSETATKSNSMTTSGPLSLWGISAGDLRGVFVMHAQPIIEAIFDDSYSASGSSFSEWLGAGGDYDTWTATFSRGFNSDHGRVVLVHEGAGTILTHRVHTPDNIGSIGTGEQEYDDSLGGSNLAAPIRSGPYGDGPLWTDFYMPGVGEWLPIGHQMNIYYGANSTYTPSPINENRNYTNWAYPRGAPYSVSDSPTTTINQYIAGAYAGAGGYTNTALCASALTPDFKVQYLGAIWVAMATPAALTTHAPFEIDEWRNEGNLFTPLYPEQPDPENPGGVIPFPHRGDHAILLDPIFTGPMP